MKKYQIQELLGRLDGQQLSALQIAALLGDTFSLDHVLALASIRPSKMLDLLDQMCQLDLIGKKTHGANGTYFFCNKKLPKIILESMSEEKKRMYIGDFIDHFEKNLLEDDENPQLLAELFLQFRENKKSYEYNKKLRTFCTQSIEQKMLSPFTRR